MNAPAIGEIIRRDGAWWKVTGQYSRPPEPGAGVAEFTIIAEPYIPPVSEEDDWHDHPHNPVSTEEQS